MTPNSGKKRTDDSWLVKGHLACHTWSEEDIISMYDSYFRRLWNNESGCLDIYEEGFEEAYEVLTWTKNEHQD